MMCPVQSDHPWWCWKDSWLAKDFTSLWIRSPWSVPPFFQSTHPPPAPQYPTYPQPTTNILSNDITTHHQWRSPSWLEWYKTRWLLRAEEIDRKSLQDIFLKILRSFRVITRWIEKFWKVIISTILRWCYYLGVDEKWPNYRGMAGQYLMSHTYIILFCTSDDEVRGGDATIAMVPVLVIWSVGGRNDRYKCGQDNDGDINRKLGQEDRAWRAAGRLGSKKWYWDVIAGCSWTAYGW